MRTYKFLGKNISTIYPFSCFKLVYNYFLCTLGSPCGDQKESSKLIKKKRKKKRGRFGTWKLAITNFYFYFFYWTCNSYFPLEFRVECVWSIPLYLISLEDFSWTNCHGGAHHLFHFPSQMINLVLEKIRIIKHYMMKIA